MTRDLGEKERRPDFSISPDSVALTPQTNQSPLAEVARRRWSGRELFPSDTRASGTRPDLGWHPMRNERREIDASRRVGLLRHRKSPILGRAAAN